MPSRSGGNGGLCRAGRWRAGEGIKAARRGKPVDRRKGGAGEDDTAEFAERGADHGGGVQTGERQLAVARAPPQPRQIGRGQLVDERRELPHQICGVGSERGEIKRHDRSESREFGQQMPDVVFVSGFGFGFGCGRSAR